MYTNAYISQTFLESCVRDRKIFIDTSALMQDSSPKFFENIAPILKRERKVIFVPFSVKHELEKLINDADFCKRRRAIEALKLLTDNAQVIEFCGDNDCYFADNDILATVTKLRLKHEIVLVTQDRNLASAVLNLGKDTYAVRNVKKIFVQRLDERGFLQRVFAKPKPNAKGVVNTNFADTSYHTPFGDFNISYA